jgi:predicted anti-sigma-YlaC factor YlaD
MGQISLPTCDRMRELFSASLDGELSELDHARLEAHLASCAGCLAYANASESATRLVRQTPLEDIGVPIVIPRRRLAFARKLQVTAAAAAVAVTVGLSAAIGTLSGPSSHHPQPVSSSSELRFPEQELRMLQRASQIREAARVHNRFAL